MTLNLVDRMLERLPEMSAAELAELERNARRLQEARPDDSSRAQAAVREERSRRAVVEQTASAQAQTEISRRMAGLSFADRVEAAFREQPPSAWEVRAIRALDEHEGDTTEQLSAALGYSGGYINMAFGTLCHDRQAWLGPPPPALRGGGVVYSGLLATFVEQTDEAGRRTTQWWFKPEARAGLESAGVLKPERPPS